jgi:hypothetical protein
MQRGRTVPTTTRSSEHGALVDEGHARQPTVVARDTADDDGAVVEPATVWRVQLRRGDVRDREGTLLLDADALVFRDSASAEETRLGFGEIRSARRVKASPILIVVHDDGGERSETAYYFSPPPPLEAPPPGSAGTTSSGRPLGPFAAIRRTSKRRHQRENVRYLATKAGGLKTTIQAWVDEIGERTGP